MDQPRAIYSGAQADPGKVLDKLAAADVDGYLLSLSTARHFESHLAGRAVVVSVSQDHQGAQQVVEQAVAVGASALKYEVYPYTEAESATMRGYGSTDPAYGIPITYTLSITTAGLLSLSYSYNGGATQAVISNQQIETANGALPAAVRFGFAGSTGGSDMVQS